MQGARHPAAGRASPTPATRIAKEALPVLKDLGIKFARRGGARSIPYKEGRGFAYEPGLDHPLLVPVAGDARPAWTLDDFKRAVAQAKHGKIAVLQFHGVPDTAHDWVNTTKEQFEAYMKYLADEKFTVIAMRDLAKYVDPAVVPNDPFGVIEDRKKLIEAKRDGDERPAGEGRRRAAVLAGEHAASSPLRTGRDGRRARADRRRGDRGREAARDRAEQRPSGRPAIRCSCCRTPAAGTRASASATARSARSARPRSSVFAPWADGGYAVADVPEAVWFEPDGKPRAALPRAHARPDHLGQAEGRRSTPLEWTRNADGSLALERTLPNKVTLAAKVMPGKDGVRMEFRVTNGSAEKLTGLRVQMCVMLAGLTGFDDADQRQQGVRRRRSPRARTRPASAG